MNVFDSAFDVAINIVTGGQAALIEKEVEIGGEIVNVAIDYGNEVVRIGGKIFRAIPGEFIYPGAGPLAGLLKDEVEDELILLTPLGIMPSITIFINGAIAVLELLHIIQTRTMMPEEVKIAEFVFGGSISGLDNVLLTNLGGLSGRAFTVPLNNGQAAVNLGGHYVHDGPVSNIPVLMHELMHVWQIERSLLPEIYLCKGLSTQTADASGDDQYGYTAGDQWASYTMEQQASIVEGWVRGRFRLGLPEFRYVNGNVRTGNNDAETQSGGSLRTYLAEAGAAQLNLRTLNPERPVVTW